MPGKINKIIIFYSEKDIAGKNIAMAFEKIFSNPEVKLLSTADDIVYSNIENISRKERPDFVIFASRHASYKHEKLLTCHPIGNFSRAELGGNDYSLCQTNAFMLKKAIISLNKNCPYNYEARIEATHHGPYCDVPCMFMEVGTTEEEWNDRVACEAVAKSVVDVINCKDNYNNIKESAIGIGGLHSSSKFLEIMLETGYAIGHICPKYMNKLLSEKMMQEMIEKTIPQPKTIFFDWKSTENKQELLRIAEKTGLVVKKLR